jgi:hypothetical protein
MGNRYDIYNVTMIGKYSDTETGGLRGQEGYKGIFRGDLCTISESFERGEANYLKRVLLQYRVQSEICYPEIKWSGTGKSQDGTSSSQETYLRAGGIIDIGYRMGGGGVSLFHETTSIAHPLDAMDAGEIQTHSAGRKEVIVNQCKADRPQAQRQEKC